MSKNIGKIFVLLLVFGSGYLFAIWRFNHGETWRLEESIEVSAANGKGSLPKGTELKYQSRAHEEVYFYTFVRIPLEKAKQVTSRVESNADHDIKWLHTDSAPNSQNAN